CTPGVGYWTTDAGTWNQNGEDGILYKCTSANTWEIYYEPLMYPHPLRQNNPSRVEEDILSTDFTLYQNYPNPFNPSTTLSFVIGQPSFVSLKIYDVLGNEIATLVDEYKPAGKYEITFDASGLSSSVYIYQLSAENYLETRKMLLLK
ncbi:MAG: T9SS type A sorting domain-containing protein, partial [Ignavibacteriaceae bacterium]